MSSSISSFKNSSTALLAAVLLLGVGAEFAFRQSLGFKSVDEAHIRQIPAISARLAGGPAPKILFLGNSLTRAGVDVDELRRSIALPNASAMRIERVFPDDTRIGEWYYAFKRFFVDQDHIPDVLVLSFVNRQLEDFRKMDPSRLGSVYSDLHHAPEVFREDLTQLDDRVEYLLAGCSQAFANRTRVKRVILDKLIPNYRSSAQRLNDTMKMTESSGAPSRPASYSRLKRLLALASRRRIRVIVAAMPLPEVYPVDPALLEILRNSGAAYVDCRNVEGIGPKQFVDGLHLDAEGARLYTRAFAQRLGELEPARLLSRDSRSRKALRP